MSRLLETVPMPPMVARLPRDRHGYPVPWFVAPVAGGGDPDLRVASGPRYRAAVMRGLCWVCGGKLGKYLAFVLGPMCTINRLSAEPPGHRDCCLYSVQVCPFLGNPGFVRRPAPMPGGSYSPAGMSAGNPGVAAVWITEHYRRVRVAAGEGGELLYVGLPRSVSWWRAGLPADPADVTTAIGAGFATLAAELDADVGQARADEEQARGEERGQAAAALRNTLARRELLETQYAAAVQLAAGREQR